MFLPGGWLDDVLLRKLLQILCNNRHFLVVDSIHLDITDPRKENDSLQNPPVQDYTGLVLPFHVNMGNQLSVEATKNHWVITIANWQDGTFTTFGIEEELSEKWKSELQMYLGVVGHNIELKLCLMEVGT